MPLSDTYADSSSSDRPETRPWSATAARKPGCQPRLPSVSREWIPSPPVAHSRSPWTSTTPLATPTVTALPTSFHCGPLRCPRSAGAVHPRGKTCSASASPIAGTTSARPHPARPTHIAGGGGIPSVEPPFRFGTESRPSQSSVSLGPTDAEAVIPIPLGAWLAVIAREQDLARVAQRGRQQEHPAPTLRHPSDPRIHDPDRPSMAELTSALDQVPHRGTPVESQHVLAVLDEDPGAPLGPSLGHGRGVGTGAPPAPLAHPEVRRSARPARGRCRGGRPQRGRGHPRGPAPRQGLAPPRVEPGSENRSGRLARLPPEDGVDLQLRGVETVLDPADPSNVARHPNGAAPLNSRPRCPSAGARAGEPFAAGPIVGVLPSIWCAANTGSHNMWPSRRPGPEWVGRSRTCAEEGGSRTPGRPRAPTRASPRRSRTGCAEGGHAGDGRRHPAGRS